MTYILNNSYTEHSYTEHSYILFIWSTPANTTSGTYWSFQEPIDWRYLPYVRPIFDAYVRGYSHNSYGLQNGTNVPPF